MLLPVGLLLSLVGLLLSLVGLLLPLVGLLLPLAGLLLPLAGLLLSLAGLLLSPLRGSARALVGSFAAAPGAAVVIHHTVLRPRMISALILRGRHRVRNQRRPTRIRSLLLPRLVDAFLLLF